MWVVRKAIMEQKQTKKNPQKNPQELFLPTIQKKKIRLNEIAPLSVGVG